MSCPAGLVACILSLLVSLSACGESPPETSPVSFGPSLIDTVDGEYADLDDFYLDRACGFCHPRQLEEVTGSMHSVAHEDRFYRMFAEVAREEAGEEMYTFCSGCHSPAGVVTGYIPGTPEEQLPPEAKAGVSCLVCHKITEITGHEGPFGEPGNASFVLDPGRTMFGTSGDIKKNAAHRGARRPFYETSEFCANCHTVIHPVNGLHLEHTYAEWKKTAYAEAGIQCQDCHMRSVEDAVEVARTMKPVVRKGRWMLAGPEREIANHFFVGGNSNAAVLGGGRKHAAMARERLKSAGDLAVRDRGIDDAGVRSFDLVVRNVAAGHDLPTSLVEIREMWVEVRVTDASGRTVLSQGVVDAEGEIPEGAIRFGAVLEDADGNPTIRLWEAARVRSHRTVPAKSEDATRVVLPPASDGELTVEARLLYRSASPAVVREIMKDEAFTPEIVEMATIRAVLSGE